MFSVYQHWDPLKVCVVGRSYPPEFYSWINKPAVRSLFEKIAIETEEDYQNIVKKLESFGVNVVRTNLAKHKFIDGKYVAPPMNPRDSTVMVGQKFYSNSGMDFSRFYSNVKDTSWPECHSLQDFEHLPNQIKQECIEIFRLNDYVKKDDGVFDHIEDLVRQQGNPILKHVHGYQINGAMISRIGKDLYFGTSDDKQDINALWQVIENEFPQTRNHIVNTNGHSDATYCPVCPGLIVSLYDIPCYADTFPGWEVVYLPHQSWSKVKDFTELKKKNLGKWWIPGFEQDQDVIDTVKTWLTHWTGYVEETVFDVNMLIVDPKNVIVFNYNKQVFDAFHRYGITPHVINFRHRYFWDGGIHCVTSDLHREGAIKDYFPERTKLS